MVEAQTDGWTRVIEAADLTDGKATRVEAFGIAVLVLKNGDAVFAVADRCTHQGAPLSRGPVKLADATVTCPAHGSIFSLEDGRVRRGPATQPLQAFEARLHGGAVEIRPRA